MKRTRLILKFGPDKVEKAVTYHLVRDFGLWINILRAAVQPGQEGSLLMEVEGDVDTLNAALAYLEEEGVKVIPLGQRVVIDEENCVHCGACTGVCLSGALALDQSSQLKFDVAACVACAVCVSACPLRVIEVCF